MNQKSNTNVLHSSIVRTKAIYLKRRYNTTLPKNGGLNIDTHQIEYIYNHIFSKEHVQRLTKLYFQKDKSMYHNEVSLIVNKYVVDPQLSIFRYNESRKVFSKLPVEQFKKTIDVRIAAQQKGIINIHQLSQKPVPTNIKKKQYIYMKKVILKQQKKISALESKMEDISFKYKGSFEFHQQIVRVLSQYNECIDTGGLKELKEIKEKWELEYKNIVPQDIAIVNEFTPETSMNSNVFLNFFNHYANMMDLIMDYNEVIKNKNYNRLEKLQKSWDLYVLGINEHEQVEECDAQVEDSQEEHDSEIEEEENQEGEENDLSMEDGYQFDNDSRNNGKKKRVQEEREFIYSGSEIEKNKHKQRYNLRKERTCTNSIDKDCVSNSSSNENDIVENQNEDSQMDEDSQEDGSEYEDNISYYSNGSYVSDDASQESDNSMGSMLVDDKKEHQVLSNVSDDANHDSDNSMGGTTDSDNSMGSMIVVDKERQESKKFMERHQLQNMEGNFHNRIMDDISTSTVQGGVQHNKSAQPFFKSCPVILHTEPGIEDTDKETPKYAVFHSMGEPFDTVLYSGSHKKSGSCTIHNSSRVCLRFQNYLNHKSYMIIINQKLVHSGGSSVMSSITGNYSNSARLFGELTWVKNNQQKVTKRNWKEYPDPQPPNSLLKVLNKKRWISKSDFNICSHQSTQPCTICKYTSDNIKRDNENNSALAVSTRSIEEQGSMSIREESELPSNKKMFTCTIDVDMYAVEDQSSCINGLNCGNGCNHILGDLELDGWAVFSLPNLDNSYDHFNKVKLDVQNIISDRSYCKYWTKIGHDGVDKCSSRSQLYVFGNDDEKRQVATHHSRNIFLYCEYMWETVILSMPKFHGYYMNNIVILCNNGQIVEQLPHRDSPYIPKK